MSILVILHFIAKLLLLFCSLYNIAYNRCLFSGTWRYNMEISKVKFYFGKQCVFKDVRAKIY